MGSLNRHQQFDPFDLELINRVYDFACAYMEARDLYRDAAKDTRDEYALRKIVFVCAGTGSLDFDTLCDRVLASLDRTGSRAVDHLIN
jgi:hypothetical protein